MFGGIKIFPLEVMVMLDGSGFCGFDICKKRLKTLATQILLENDLLIDDSGLTKMLKLK